MTDLFGGAATYYARYRSDHGEQAIGHLARAFGPDGVVLDLGCGPGTVAIPLAGRVRAVLAVDPDEEMLAEGRRLAGGAAGDIRWIRGDSATLRALPPFDHVVMGRSFHWMDRRAVLADLDALLPAHGAVALVGPTREEGEPPWEAVVRPVRAAFGLNESGLDKQRALGSFQATGEHHDEVLAGSPFGRVESARFERTVSMGVDELVGLQLSFSYSAPARLGDRLAAFTEEVRRALLAARPSGVWEERRTTEVLIARRP
ncbi:class I SAM-dependent methyltransferase [Nonomuraea rhodomycinica]|uniref:Methyltransferase domain-containing protein n=1 Tax=Nonomuraea rhodomycinica TaxID=1712872 RepID=A0A7Y6MC05_9ACTN|nr:class I SAM-dependent methyltransferase [Nonomuraea rhodomycinica]NUW42873.1 methyltransferase domain-containing protein [Nonomuraea rhodomycinica]